MQETFAKIMSHLFASEGGYVDHPRDPGGATNHGITFAVLQKWRGKRITKTDVRNLKQAEAADIYKAWYWDKVYADLWPAGPDYSVFDFGVNAGPNRAIKTLQKTVGVVPDGKVGPITKEAVKKCPPRAFIDTYAKRRLSFYRSLRTWRTFGRGWARRVEEVRKRSLALMS